MSYVVGVDQGNTHTRAAVSSEDGHILGVGSAGGGYATREPLVAMAAVKTAVLSALAVADVQRADVALLYAGMTGADWQDEYDLLHAQLTAQGLAPAVRVTNDSLIALRGGTAQPYGAVIVAGTGANVALIAPDGTTFAYHYYVERNLQGGMGLGRRALQAIYRAEMGRDRPTALTAPVLDLFGLTDVDGLLRADCEARLTDADFKHIAPLVFEAAVAQDAAARHILIDFGSGLAELVTTALRRFEMHHMPIEVVLSGNIFKGRGTLLEQTLRTEIAHVAPLATLVSARYEPVVGAVLLGLEAIGRNVTPAIQQAIESSCQRWQLIRQKDDK